MRLVGADGQQLGVVPTPRALALAQSEGFDLIEVAPQAVPPVCKIGDYGKYRYEQQQREKEAKKKQKTINWKEVRIAPKIDEHDLQTKIRTATRLLDHGDKLKLVVRFRGRELAHPDRGRVLLIEMAERLKEHAVVERPPLLEGRQMIMVMDPRRQAGQPVRTATGPAPEGPAAPGGPTRPVPATPAGPRPGAPAPAPAAARPGPAASTAARPAAGAAPRPAPAARPASAPSVPPRPAASRAPRAS